MNWVKGLRRVVLVTGVAVSLPVAGWTFLNAYLEHSALARERDEFLAIYEPTCAELLEGYMPPPVSAPEESDGLNFDERLTAQRARLEWFRQERSRLEQIGERADALIAVLEDQIQFPEGERRLAAIEMCHRYDVDAVKGELSQSRFEISYGRFEWAMFWTAVPAFLFGFTWFLIGPVASLLGWLREGFSDE